jgi:5-(carboxyamino)imidazole ribonucleotide synthase
VRNLRIGLLGGGQLARMLALRAFPLGLKVAVLCAHADDPAAQVTSDVTVGSLSDEACLKKFLGGVEAVTFESEFVNTALLERCLPEGVLAFPQLDVIETIQDRLTQKRLLDAHKIPTSPWLPVETELDLKRAAELFPQGFVLKQRRFGYDGYGTFIFKSPGNSPHLSVLEKSAFGFIAEAFVPYRRELAISFVRSRDKQFLALPLVESVQKDARCFSVKGPLRHPQIARLTSAFKRLMESQDYHGILAAELFDTGRGLLVNELAPRVHNSAHYSLDALACDQFEYHLRAGLELPLPKLAQLSKGFAMVNLLGEGAAEPRLSYDSSGRLHWYGKKENRPGRKLGHINVLDRSPEAALRRAL